MTHLAAFSEAVAPYLGEAAMVALVLALTGLAYLACSRGLTAARRKGYLAEGIGRQLRRVLKVLAVLVAIALVLNVLGVLESALAALTAVLAMVAIGFVAVWSVASNISCAFIMLVTRPFRVGDRIELPPDALAGTVVNFNLIYTTLQADDETLVQIPNNLFFQRPVRRRPGSADIDLEQQLPRTENARV